MTYHSVSIIICHLVTPEFYRHIAHYGTDHNDIKARMWEELVTFEKETLVRKKAPKKIHSVHTHIHTIARYVVVGKTTEI